MKIALEASSLFFKNYTGIPFYIHNLYLGMKELPDVEPTLAFRLKKRFSKKTDLQKELLNSPHIWHQNNVLFTTKKIQVAHSLHTPFLNAKKSLKVATVHDLAVHLPELEEFELTSTYFKQKRFTLLKEFSKKADTIITVSEKTKKDFLRFFDFPEERIHAVPLAPSLEFSDYKNNELHLLKKHHVEPKRYFIALGGVSVRKNTFNLIKGFAQSHSKTDYKLVVAGKIEQPHGSEVQEYIIKNKLEKKVLITGYLSNSELSALYYNASAFLFPTLYEGFGIPILEAMSVGLPVLTSTSGAAPETSAGHGILVNPLDAEDIANGIDKLPDFTKEQCEKAKEYASSFTWNRTSSETVKVYRKYM